MSRRYVNQLTAQENVDQVFLASEKQLRPNRNGNLYLQLVLSDRSGSINARLWNASEGLYRTFENGDNLHRALEELRGAFSANEIAVSGLNGFGYDGYRRTAVTSSSSTMSSCPRSRAQISTSSRFHPQ